MIDIADSYGISQPSQHDYGGYGGSSMGGGVSGSYLTQGAAGGGGGHSGHSLSQSQSQALSQNDFSQDFGPLGTHARGGGRGSDLLSQDSTYQGERYNSQFT